MPGGEQEGMLRPAGLRGRLGRVQPFVPLLLHVALGEAEQSLSVVPAGVVHSTNGEIIRDLSFSLALFLVLSRFPTRDSTRIREILDEFLPTVVERSRAIFCPKVKKVRVTFPPGNAGMTG